MIDKSQRNKMVESTPACKTTQDGSQDRGAGKGAVRVFQRAVGRFRRCFDGIFDDGQGPGLPPGGKIA